MNDLQPNTVLDSTSCIAPTPMLRIPQTPPEQVIATRQRYVTPTEHLQSSPQCTPLPQTSVTPMPVVPLSELPPQTPFPAVEMLPVRVAPVAIEQQHSSATPRIEFSIALRQPGVTYIPRMMMRHKEPSVVDALIACGTLLLLGLCVLMVLYYFSMP